MNDVNIVPTFEELTRIDADAWDSPAGWRQGRGAWGGLLVGTAVRAAQEADVRDGEDASPRFVREVSVDMLGPVAPGRIPIGLEPLRQGSGTSAWRVEFRGDGDVLASSSVVLGRNRSGDQPSLVDERRTPPADLDWARVPIIEIAPPMAPEFAQHLQFRPITGIPYSGQRDDVVCWVRFPQDVACLDAALLLGMVDALWPASLVTFTDPRPVATLTFAASLLVDPATVDPDLPLLHHGRLVSMSGGYATETRELWTADGRLAVWNTQVMAVIR